MESGQPSVNVRPSAQALVDVPTRWMAKLSSLQGCHLQAQVTFCTTADLLCVCFQLQTHVLVTVPGAELRLVLSLALGLST